MNLCEIFFDLHKTQFFLKTFKFADILVRHFGSPFWSTIRTSLPRFEVSRDVGSGTRDLGRDLSDLKTSGNFTSELSKDTKDT